MKEKSFDFQNKEDKEEDDYEKDIKIIYFKKEDIPKLDIINNYLMTCDWYEYKINDYIK